MDSFKRLVIVISTIIAAAIVITGCSDGVFTGDMEGNQPPEVWLSSGPVENDTTSYQVHFYWSGWDPDGEISHFEFLIADGDPIGFNPADTAIAENWTTTGAFDSIFRVSADEYVGSYADNPLYTVFDQTHTFFIRAVDLEGMRSRPAVLSFTAWTLAPFVEIERPEGSGRTYSTVITFGWTGRDPIDSPSNSQNPDSIRYLYSQVVDQDGIYNPAFLIIDDLNASPERYSHLWSDWIPYDAPGDSGRVTMIGDDEILEINRSHIFAVQAMDEAGAVTSLFRRDHNVRQFIVSFKAGPLLTINEQYLGGFQFLGATMNAAQAELPPGIPLNFFWEADASSYGGEIQGYRYGWDVQDLNDPADWETVYSPFVKSAKERVLYSGIHTFYLEVKDNGGKVTRARIQVEIIPFSMERDLLIVDDAPLGTDSDPRMMVPSEAEHDEFWLDIASRTTGFLPERDVVDCSDLNFSPPEMDLIGKYKNIVWLFSNSSSSTLGQVITFIPESMLTQSGTLAINYLSIFLAKGGHLWMQGRADRAGGGLSTVFPSSPSFPASFKFDMASDPQDTSGVYSMPYKDFCISVVDKIVGVFRVGSEMPARDVRRDGLRYIIKDPDDTLAMGYTGMPERIDLWEEVTCPTCFFNPAEQGFTYVEVYDPGYWLETSMIAQQSCFHPLYRMRSRNTTSPVDYTTVAFLVTKYSEKVPVVGEGVAVAANSFVFGLPLWFFDHAAVDSIADAIFTEWQILDE